RAAPSPARQLHQDSEWFADVEVSARDGMNYRFYDDLLEGRIIMVNFLNADCDLLCPLMTDNLVRVQTLFESARRRRRLHVLDLAAARTRYAGGSCRLCEVAFGWTGWQLFTGQPVDSELLRHRLGGVDSDPARDADLAEHHGTVRLA